PWGWLRAGYAGMSPESGAAHPAAMPAPSATTTSHRFDGPSSRLIASLLEHLLDRPAQRPDREGLRQHVRANHLDEAVVVGGAAEPGQEEHGRRLGGPAPAHRGVEARAVQLRGAEGGRAQGR